MFRLQITLAARYLWGRKLRTALTTLAIVFGTLVIFATNMLLPTMMKTLQTSMLAASGQVDVTISHKTGEAFASTMLNKLRKVEGVRAMAGSLTRTVNIPENYYARTDITALNLTGIDPRTAQLLRRYPIQSGRFLSAGDTDAAVISANLAGDLGLKLGDKLHIPMTEGLVNLRIVGLLPARSLPGNEEVLVTVYEAQKLLNLPNAINTIDINLESIDTAQREAVQRAIQDVVGKDYTLGALSGGSEIMASMKTGQVAFNFFGFMAMFMGAFIIFNTFRTIVAERRHDIGMLRAIGASRGTIVGMFLTEGLLQGTVGTGSGIILGYMLGAFALSLMSPIMNQFLHLEISAPVIAPSLFVTTILVGVGMTLLAGLLPAVTASRVTPLEALRPSLVEMAQRTITGGAIAGFVMIGVSIFVLFSGNNGLIALGGMLLLLGLILAAPALVRPISTVFGRLIARAFARDGTATLAQTNLTRQPSRVAITASATMIGIAIIVGLGGLVWSLTGNFLGVLQRSLGSDYIVMPPSVGLWKNDVGASKGLAEKLRAVPGVDAVSTLRFASAAVKDTTVSMLGIDPKIYPQVASLTFQQGDAQTAFAQLASGRAIIPNGIFAAQEKLKIGDTVRLYTPRGDKEYLVVGVAGDYLNAKITTAYISQENLQTDFRKDEDVLLQIKLKSGADAAQVEPRLQRILKDYSQFKLVSGKSYFEENKQLFKAVFAGYFVLLAILAFPSLIALLNTLTIGVIERTREIGMLRAIGATRRQVKRIVIAESLLLAAMGTAFGLLSGLYLGYIMIMGMSISGFPVTYAFPYQGLIAAAATGLIFGVIAALLPASQAAQMEIVRALRFE